MTTRQKSVMVFIAALILVAVSVYVFRPHRAHRRPIAEPTEDSISPVNAAVAAATLLHQTTDVKYASLRTNMAERLAGKTAYVEIVTDSPDALWPMGGIPFPAYAGIDMSSEPKMKLRMPNEDLSVISVVNSGLWSRLHYIHKAKLTDAGSREVQPNDSTGDGAVRPSGPPPQIIKPPSGA